MRSVTLEDRLHDRNNTVTDQNGSQIMTCLYKHLIYGRSMFCHNETELLSIGNTNNSTENINHITFRVYMHSIAIHFHVYQ